MNNAKQNFFILKLAFFKSSFFAWITHGDLPLFIKPWMRTLVFLVALTWLVKVVTSRSQPAPAKSDLKDWYRRFSFTFLIAWYSNYAFLCLLSFWCELVFGSQCKYKSNYMRSFIVSSHGFRVHSISTKIVYGKRMDTKPVASDDGVLSIMM